MMLTCVAAALSCLFVLINRPQMSYTNEDDVVVVEWNLTLTLNHSYYYFDCISCGQFVSLKPCIQVIAKMVQAKCIYSGVLH